MNTAQKVQCHYTHSIKYLLIGERERERESRIHYKCWHIKNEPKWYISAESIIKSCLFLMFGRISFDVYVLQYNFLSFDVELH